MLPHGLVAYLVDDLSRVSDEEPRCATALSGCVMRSATREAIDPLIYDYGPRFAA